MKFVTMLFYSPNSFETTGLQGKTVIFFFFFTVGKTQKVELNYIFKYKI